MTRTCKRNSKKENTQVNELIDLIKLPKRNYQCLFSSDKDLGPLLSADIRKWQDHEVMRLRQSRKEQQRDKTFHFTKFLSSSGTPRTLVDKRSFDFVGARENFILSPRLITWRVMGLIR